MGIDDGYRLREVLNSGLNSICLGNFPNGLPGFLQVALLGSTLKLHVLCITIATQPMNFSLVRTHSPSP